MNGLLVDKPFSISKVMVPVAQSLTRETQGFEIDFETKEHICQENEHSLLFYVHDET